MSVIYNVNDHILLRDMAHQRCIYEDEEFERYVALVMENEYMPGDPQARMVPFEVEVSEWPPAHRTPLALLFGIGGKPQGPFTGMDWLGVHLAVERNFWTDRALYKIAKSMVGDEEMNKAPYRQAYMWQVEEFDPARHVVIRWLLEEHDIDIAHFWEMIYPTRKGLIVFDTTNPRQGEEMESGSHVPYRQCIGLDQVDLLLGREAEVEEDVGEVKELPPIPIQDDGTYSHEAVEEALFRVLGRQPDIFGGSFSDSRIVPVESVSALLQFLASDPTSGHVYVDDGGDRNYDCDNFADSLRVALNARAGLNSCGIVWGDSHAWNFFVVRGDNGPAIIFVEPQRDVFVDELVGAYSVERRCAIYL